MPILIDHYGNGAYGQLKIASGYGRLFGDRFALSVRFFYLLEHARHYPSRHSFFVDLGFDCKISNKLRMCASISNPFNMRYGIVGGEHIPIIFNVLASCKLSGKMFADLRFSKSFSGGFEVGGSFLYCPLLNFMLDLFCSNFKIDLGINIPLRKFLLSVRSCWFYRVSFAPKLQFSYFHQQKEMP